jgi:hypothetical protein
MPPPSSDSWEAILTDAVAGPTPSADSQADNEVIELSTSDDDSERHSLSHILASEPM